MNQPGKLVIETFNLKKSYGNVHALESVNLQVASHSIFGFLGPKVAWLTATGQAVSVDTAISSLAATLLWSVVFILVALVTFEKTEF